VDESTGDSRDEEGVGDLELDGMIDLLVLGSEHGSELLSLGNGSGESVEDESTCDRARTRERRRSQLERQRGREDEEEESEGTNPSWHSLFSSSCFLIMLTMISSGTSPPCRDCTRG